jgi:hypothetical protein
LGSQGRRDDDADLYGLLLFPLPLLGLRRREREENEQSEKKTFPEVLHREGIIPTPLRHGNPLPGESRPKTLLTALTRPFF